MPPSPIDKELVRRRFERSAATYDRHAVVQRGMADALADHLGNLLVGGACDRALEIGCGSGVLTERLLDRLSIRYFVVNDLSGVFECDVRALAARYPGTQFHFLAGDIERVPVPDRLDLIAANAVFQWLAHADDVVKRLAARLCEGGLLAFTTFGPANFKEVCAVTGRSLGYRSLEAYRAFLGERLEVVEAWEERHVLCLDSPLDVLRHIRATGTNALDAMAWSRRDLARFSERYREQGRCERGVALTYHPLYFVCRR